MITVGVFSENESFIVDHITISLMDAVVMAAEGMHRMLIYLAIKIVQTTLFTINITFYK